MHYFTMVHTTSLLCEHLVVDALSYTPVGGVSGSCLYFIPPVGDGSGSCLYFIPPVDADS